MFSKPPHTMDVTSNEVTKSYLKEENEHGKSFIKQNSSAGGKGCIRQIQIRSSKRTWSTVEGRYNGDLTSRQNGSVGGYMVKKMIEQQEKQMSGK